MFAEWGRGERRVVAHLGTVTPVAPSAIVPVAGTCVWCHSTAIKNLNDFALT